LLLVNTKIILNFYQKWLKEKLLNQKNYMHKQKKSIKKYYSKKHFRKSTLKRLVHTVAKVIHHYADFKYKNAVAKMKDINSDKKEHVKKYKNGLRKHL